MTPQAYTRATQILASLDDINQKITAFQSGRNFSNIFGLNSRSFDEIKLKIQTELDASKTALQAEFDAL